MKNYKQSLQFTESASLQFAARLKEEVDAYKNASALAREVGVVEGTIRKWASGASQPKIVETIALARALKLNLQWLATGDGPKHPGESAILKRLVGEIVETERYVKQRPKSYGAVYSALNQHFKVITYILIAREDYDLAERYLRCWLGRLSSARSAPKKDPHWRERRRKYIFANTKGALDAQRRTCMMERFGTDAFTALDDSQVEQLYRIVASWKR